MTTISPLNIALRDLCAHVAANAAVAAITPRVTLDAPTKGATLPYVTIQPTQESRIDSHNPATPDGERSMGVQFDCDALTAHEARELAHAIESAVDECPQFSGTGEHATFLSVTFDGSFSQRFSDAEGLPQGSETTERMTCNFTIQYQITNS